MVPSDDVFKEELQKAGNRLLEQPLASTDELLDLLNQLESHLSRIEQSPSKEMHTSLSPSLKALVASELMKHSDDDVKVAVASCLSEITRITAPEAPYDDNQMKDVFQLIVSSFEKLSEKSSRSFDRRTSILETVAKVRSCVVMLDLECDGLIIEMFQHFLKSIRDYHPDNVYSSMETIMTLVFEESEYVSLELLSPILSTLKKDNEEVFPIARRLGEKVLENCASKIRPSLVQYSKSLDISLDDYSIVVSNIYHEISGDTGKNDLNASAENSVNESKLTNGASSKAAAKVPDVPETVSHGKNNPAAVSSSNPITSNGVVVAQNEEDNALVDSNSSKNPDNSDDVKRSNKADDDEIPSKPGHNSPLVAESMVDSEDKPEHTTKEKGQKHTSSTEIEPSDSSNVGEKEPEKIPVTEKNNSLEDERDPPAEVIVNLLDNQMEIDDDVQLSSLKTKKRDSATVVSPSPSGTISNKNRSKKGGKSKKNKKKSLIKKTPVSTDTASNKLSEGTSDSKKVAAGISNNETEPPTVDESKEDSDTASDPEVKLLRDEAGKKLDIAHDDDGDEPESLENQKKRKRSGKGKAKVSLEKDKTKSSAEDAELKETVSLSKSATKSANGEDHLEVTPKTGSSKKRTPGKEMPSVTEKLGANMLGKKIRVWWPDDQEFYEGTVESWDHRRKKHKVIYTDGEEEVLFLKKERWEFVEEGDIGSANEEKGLALSSPQASSEMPQTKKANKESDSSTKQGKMVSSPKSKNGGVSSTKSKGTSTKKSGLKSKDGTKKDIKSKAETSKDLTSQSGGKSVDISKSGGKTKNVEPVTPKTSKKEENETPKTVKTATTKSKGKTPKSESTIKLSSNGSGKVKSNPDEAKPGSSKVKKNQDVVKSGSSKAKESDDAKDKSNPDVVKPVSSKVKKNQDVVKSGSSKAKESDDGKEKSPILPKEPASGKRKTPDSSKAGEKSEGKSVKKRRK